MPTRILREGILTSPRMAKLSWGGEVFYRRLMSVVDDWGRYHAHPTLLRAACYPTQIDKVSDSDIGKWLGETSEAALVRVYEVCNQRYLELLDFRQQTRAKQSRFPEPPGDSPPATQPLSNQLSECKADAKQTQSLDGDVVGDGDGAAGKRRTSKTQIPKGFAISDRVRRWAFENEIFNLDDHFAYFASRARAKGYTYADWDEGFMGAVRDDWAKIGKGSADGRKKVAI